MKRIAVLTSGGDSSSMNKSLSTLAKYAPLYGCELFFIYSGYKGIYLNQIKKADYKEARTWWSLPGTKIYSDRFKDIFKEEVQIQMVANLKRNFIDYLVVIGGDGTYKGAQLLATKYGIKVFCLPGTIDNDVCSSSYSIGFLTALNNIVNTIKKIKFCMDSHAMTNMVEIMGRNCIDLTVYAGIATEADLIITPYSFYTPEEVVIKLKEIRKYNDRGIIILVVENFLGHEQNTKPLDFYVDYLNKNSGENVRKCVLGHLQRGGEPTALDLVWTSLMTKEVFNLIANNQFNKIIGMNGDKVATYDLEEGLAIKKSDASYLIKQFWNK